MRTKHFLILSVFVMGLFAFYVRGYLLRPQQTLAGPKLVSHDLGERYEGKCDICHRKQADFHEEAFGSFNVNDCMKCHGGAPIPTHSTEGSYARCLSCHQDVMDSHENMFPYENTTFDNCVGCHPGNNS